MTFLLYQYNVHWILSIDPELWRWLFFTDSTPGLKIFHNQEKWPFSLSYWSCIDQTLSITAMIQIPQDGCFPAFAPGYKLFFLTTSLLLKETIYFNISLLHYWLDIINRVYWSWMVKMLKIPSRLNSRAKVLFALLWREMSCFYISLVMYRLDVINQFLIQREQHSRWSFPFRAKEFPWISTETNDFYRWSVNSIDLILSITATDPERITLNMAASHTQILINAITMDFFALFPRERHGFLISDWVLIECYQSQQLT